MLLSIHRLRSPFALFVGCLLSLYLLHTFGATSCIPSLFSNSQAISSAPLLARQRAFWRSFYPYLLQDGPQCEPITHSEIGDLNIGYDAADHDAVRPDRLNVSDTQLSELRTSHARFTAHLKNERYGLPLVPNTRGIVTTAGGKYLPVAVVSIRMLRTTGCQLPVEVFLDSQAEWDTQICGTVLPGMNAHCVVLQDIFNASGQKETLKIDKYQYKIMSIVFSSFEEVLFIDSDCFPIYDITTYFDSEPFQSTGMIRWPDFWFPSEAPLFFDIAGIPVPSLWSRAATESGELFYSKKRHTDSLLLALYYNYYGPNFYYPLQSQGAPGEGDKETFLWGAVVFNEPFYTVQKGVQAVGYMNKVGEWRGSAMVQFDPIQDLNIESRTDLSAEQKRQSRVRPLFLHANFPKFDPGSIFQEASFGAAGPTKDADGTLRRVWFDDEKTAVEFFGFDLERRLWSVIRDIGCEFEGTFSAWNGQTDICANATNYWNALYEQGR